MNIHKFKQSSQPSQASDFPNKSEFEEMAQKANVKRQMEFDNVEQVEVETPEHVDVNQHGIFTKIQQFVENNVDSDALKSKGQVIFDKSKDMLLVGKEFVGQKLDIVTDKLKDAHEKAKLYAEIKSNYPFINVIRFETEPQLFVTFNIEFFNEDFEFVTTDLQTIESIRWKTKKDVSNENYQGELSIDGSRSFINVQTTKDVSVSTMPNNTLYIHDIDSIVDYLNDLTDFEI